jgi:hypothetical protein
MNALLTGLATKHSGSTLHAYVGGRIYFENYPKAPMPKTYPYVIYEIVSGSPQDTFSDYLDEVLVQYSLFSASSGKTEITNMYGYLTALLDGCALSVTGYSHLWMKRQGLTTTRDENAVANDGVPGISIWMVDYSIMIEKN